jgi:hypothetical protein
MFIEKYYELKVSIHDPYRTYVPGFFWQKLYLSDCGEGNVLNVHSRFVCAHGLSHGE